MIQTKFNLNFILKCLLISFVRLDTSFQLQIISRKKLHENTRQMEIYFSIILGLSKFKNILNIFNWSKLLLSLKIH